MNCKICSSPCSNLFQAQVLFQYEVSYFRCDSCQFIQTEEPYWLPEAYQQAITSLDIGLISRNCSLAERITPILRKHFGINNKFLDYGGGYGMFVRLMRDNGLEFYRQDVYCDNLFAKHFDLCDLKQDERFALVTAFEVFEHLADPLAEIENMFRYAHSILFSTLLQPNSELHGPEDWWYFIPETGQHVSLYSKNSLQWIAKTFGKNFYSDGVSLHLFTDKKLPTNILKTALLKKVANRIFRRGGQGLLQADFDKIRSQLGSQQDARTVSRNNQ